MLNTAQDNPHHRAMFTLPEIRVSAETVPALQELPPQRVVTGDKEVDAVLWLREIISTGQPGPIATAMEAARKIKTPINELEKRYTRLLSAANPGNWVVTFQSFGFADLEGLAERSVERSRRQVEAMARFPGDSIWSNTPAEEFCVAALKRCRGFKGCHDYDDGAVEKRFRKHAVLIPETLADCVYELKYWNDLYRLRHALGDAGDSLDEVSVREWFVFGLLAEITPRSHEEAKSVYQWLITQDKTNDDEYDAIIGNLLDHPGLSSEIKVQAAPL
jgi:hypothetical protein